MPRKRNQTRELRSWAKEQVSIITSMLPDLAKLEYSDNKEAALRVKRKILDLQKNNVTLRDLMNEIRDLKK